MLLVSILFPFVKPFWGFVAGKAVFRAEFHCGQEGG